MNNDTQCLLLLNEILVLFPILTIILVTVVRKRESLLTAQGRFRGKVPCGHEGRGETAVFVG